jgi:glutamyl-tRNA reductase
VAELPIAGSAAGHRLPAADAGATLAVLRGRADETVDRLLRENEPHWRSLSEADRRTVESLAQTIASRLLDQPAHRLEAEPAAAVRAGYVETLYELFALGRGRDSG